MPFYEILHAIPLTTSQQDDLSEAVTRVHSETFSTTRIIVNIKFTDVSSDVNYIGGKRRVVNHIRANVRSGPSRTREDWQNLIRTLEKAWYDIMGQPRAKEKLKPDTTLRAVIIHGSIEASMEAGFMIPKAGDDVKWLHENWETFVKKASAGEEDFVDLVAEMKERGLVNGANGV